MATRKPVRPRTRTLSRYAIKSAQQNKAPRPVSVVGGGQSGMLGSSSASAGGWG